MGWFALSILDPHPENTAVAPLCLQLTHSGGEVRHGALLIPAIGVGMADALQLCGERQSDAQWRVANMCRIAWNDAVKGWQLTNNSYTLMCVHNSERVRVGTSISVAPGDTLELGLLRFMLVAGEGEAQVEASTKGEVAPKLHRTGDTAKGTSGGLDAPKTVDREPSAFDLRDLAISAGQSGILESPTDALTDPFGMLGIEGVQSRPTADVLAELLGEISRPTQSAAPEMRASNAAPVSGHSAALLDELHNEFVRVVRDPGQLAGRTDWEGFLSFDAEPAPTLDDLCEQAEPYALMRDILTPPEHIDRTIEDFEPLASSGLLDAPNPEDVLGLFAPELVSDARTALPSLTRREHHELSPDSHVHFGSARVSEDKDKGIDNGEGAAR